MILAGDVGGTKVHLALYSFESGRLRSVREQRFPASEHASLDAVVNAFLNQPASAGAREQIVAACFGVPGPVRDGRLKLTNLPWVLDAREMRKLVGIEHIFLINDLQANGYGISELAPNSIHTLLPGDPSGIGHRGLVSAGTGLGEALLIWNGRGYLSVAS
jgi:glucokinase